MINAIKKISDRILTNSFDRYLLRRSLRHNLCGKEWEAVVQPIFWPTFTAGGEGCMRPNCPLNVGVVTNVNYTQRGLVCILILSFVLLAVLTFHNNTTPTTIKHLYQRKFQQQDLNAQSTRLIKANKKQSLDERDVRAQESTNSSRQKRKETKSTLYIAKVEAWYQTRHCKQRRLNH